MSEYLDWLPLVLLAIGAVGLAVLLQRIGVPWFVGAPVAGFGAAVILVLIGALLSPEPEPFIYVALFFAALYGAAFALLAYVIRGLMRRRRGAAQPSR